MPHQVYVDGSPCLDVVHTPGSEETELTCVSPPITTTAATAIMLASSSSAEEAFAGSNFTSRGFPYEEWASTVEVVKGRMPGLTHSVGYLSYQVRGVDACNARHAKPKTPHSLGMQGAKYRGLAPCAIVSPTENSPALVPGIAKKAFPPSYER